MKRIAVLITSAVGLVGVTALTTIALIGGGGVGGVVDSALRRGIPETSPDGYWPLEGGTPISALTGGAKLTQSGQVQFATQDGLPSSAALPDFTGGGSLLGPLPAGSVTNEWRLEFVARFGFGSDTIDDADFTIPVRLTSPNGTVNLWEILISSGTAILQWSDTSGAYTSLLDSGVVVDDGEWHHFRIDVEQSGADILASLTVDGDPAGPSTLAGKTLNSTNSRIAVNPDAEKAAYVGSVGHLAWWAPYLSAVDTYDIASGYAGETAAVRFERLCTQYSIGFDVA